MDPHGLLKSRLLTMTFKILCIQPLPASQTHLMPSCAQHSTPAHGPSFPSFCMPGSCLPLLPQGLCTATPSSCSATPLSLPLPLILCHIASFIFFIASSKAWSYCNMYIFLFMVSFSCQNFSFIKALSCSILYLPCLSQLLMQNQHVVYIQCLNEEVSKSLLGLGT